MQDTHLSHGKTEKYYRLGSYGIRCEQHSASTKCKKKPRLLQFGISGHFDFLLLYAKHRRHRKYYAGNSAVIFVMLQVTGEISRPQTRHRQGSDLQFPIEHPNLNAAAIDLRLRNAIGNSPILGQSTTTDP